MPSFYRWLLPILCILAIAPFTPELDLFFSHLFYTPAIEGKGSFVENGLTCFLYNYGERLGFFVAFCSLGGLLFSWKFNILRKGNKAFLVLLLTFVLGAGLITNFALKGYWNRPRPKQVTEFGGHYPFRPFYSPQFKKQEEPQKSFPSGHATVGFYYFALYLIAKRYRHRYLAWVALVLVILMGGGLSVTRIAQGGHFFSDTLFSALVMWLVALFIDWLIFESALIQKIQNKLDLFRNR